MQKILLIDDDRELTSLISQFLVQNGFLVEVLNDGRQAAEKVFKIQPDLIILDLMLPGTDGLAICREIRPHFAGAIIMLTALVDDIDEVTGLEVGADDYLCKPLKPRVLLAHIRAQLRRQSSLQEQHKDLRVVCDGSLQLDWRNRSVSYLNEEVTLSSAEFELLWVLAQSAGSIISRDSLHRKIFNLEYDAMDRSIDLRISRLRKKLGDDPKQPQVIKTIRNKGYLIAD
ncbi:DNA-binding response regulator [Pseudoalteromonas luteoviolacea]|uniref:DNA-binding response regulator n=1 Tax=Pseudoalteromonas luteoviolacea TaxID=43657 RepID=A0A1C0TJV7_9GAMM|nr:response regulator [Pseudoalteromonas luteoviolacea]MBQ4813942.1 response regulator [Pseudoalteromonas luteoviolacea]OCQ18809.1 DNA-binding response regulator [Pseudoalteromonas luteoviolacea]